MNDDNGGAGSQGEADRRVRDLLDLGTLRGFLTYEDLNENLPDEVVSPEKLDSLLMMIDEMGIKLIDENDIGDYVKNPEKPVIQGEAVEVPEDEDRRQIDLDFETELARVSVERFDDPIRVYLTQMSGLPTLSREQEVQIAKKIEITRKIFRSKVLENDYCLRSAVEIVQQVARGGLPFDRTMKISAEGGMPGNEAVERRMSLNLASVRRMLGRNRADWGALRQTKTRKEQDELRLAIRRRRRRGAKLVEELALRTSKVTPLMKKLSSISTRMVELEQRLIELKKPKDPGKDLETCLQELSGLEDLVLENAQDLHKRVVAIRKIFFKYEDAKRRLSSGNLRLVVSIAAQHRSRGVPFLDIIQEGNIGLMRAVDTYEYRGGCKFSIHATWWIREAIARGIAEDARTSGTPAPVIEAASGLRDFGLRDIHKAMLQELGRDPTAQEVAERAEITVSELHQLLKMSGQPIRPPELTTQEIFKDMIIEQALKVLTVQEQEILKLRHGIGDGCCYTLEEVARIFGLTAASAGEVEARAQRKLHRLRARRKTRVADAGLRAVMEAWPRLSTPIKAGILAMVEATAG